MTKEEANKVLEELYEVRPERLNDKTKRLFEAIMTIADERDEALNELKNFIPKKTYNQTKKTLKGIIARKEADLYEANNRINDLLDTIKLKEDQIEYIENEYGRTIEQKDKMISEMADYIKNPSKSIYLPQIFKARMGKREAIIKYFEERCK